MTKPADLIDHYRYLEGLSYLAFRMTLKNYNTHQDISHPGKLYFEQWRVPIFIYRVAIQGKIKIEKEKYKSTSYEMLGMKDPPNTYSDLSSRQGMVYL
jgi:hypothetical protein